MKKEVKIFTIIGMVVLLASCSNYKYLSDNDVYSQKPTDINLQEDETDLTSFNAFKAREKGEYKQEYKDPRINQRSFDNRFMLLSSYGMMNNYNSMYYGNYYSFGRSGLYSPYMGNSYMGFNYGYGGYPMHYYNPYNSFYGGGYFYDPYGYGFYNGYYGYNPYYYNPYNYGGYGAYNYGGYGTISNSNPSVSTQNTYYGKRNNYTSTSKRSSTYPATYQNKKVVTTGTPYIINQNSMGTSRRAAGMSQPSGYNNNNPGYTNINPVNNNNNSPTTTNSNYRRTSTSTYTPNESMRTSGKMNVQRNVRTNESRSNNSPAINRRTSPSVQSTPQVRGSFSTSGSSRGSSSPSTTRSTGSTNSSHTGRR